ncbi:MAG: CHAT domain-containing protein [Bacteroidetes bacterium]|nr:CHAT domain-containing protein [Bacteroidota bacterium]
MKYFLIILLALTTISLKAQNNATEIKEVAFKVLYTTSRHDTLYGIIEGGSNDGIEMGMLGRCRSVYNEKSGKSGYSELGYIKIAYVNKDTSAAIITLNNKNSTKDSVQEGDLITVNITLPKKDYHSIYYNLYLLNIQFKDVSDIKYTTPKYLYNNDNKQLEDSITLKIVKDVKDVYNTVKDMFDKTHAINVVIEAGRYKGKSTMEVMRDVTPKDVRHFLQFVTSYPGKYIGKTWKSSETFATWVMNKGLTSSLELQDELYALRNSPEELKKYAISNRASIIAEKTVDNISDNAKNYISDGNYDKAKELIDFGFDIANTIKDTVGLASMLVCKAEWFQNLEKYKEAIPLCDQAIQIAKASKNYIDEMYASFKKTFCLYKLANYTDAKNNSSIVSERLIQIKPNLSNDNFNYFSQKLYDYSGWIDFEAGNYKDALVDFTNSIEVCKTLNNYSSKNNLARAYEYLGRSYILQANYNRSLPYFDSSIAIYRGFGKSASEAIVTNRIAYSNFKMGNYKKSIEIYEKTIPILLKEKDFDNASYAKSMRAQSYWNIGNHAEAINGHQSAIEYAKLANQNSRQAFSWGKLGDLYKLTGEKIKALNAYDSSVYYYAIVKDSSSIIEHINDVGEVYKNDKNYEKAVEYYQKALKYAENLSNKKVQVSALYNIADASFYYDTTKSIIYYKKCRELCKITGDQVNEYYSTANLAVLAARGNHIKEADQFIREALIIAEKTKNPEDLAWVYSKIANSAMQQLEFDEAEKYYVKSLKIYDSTGNKIEYAKGVPNLGWLNLSKGNFELAEKYLKTSVVLADSISNNLLKGDALNGLSYLYDLLGEFKKGFAANDTAMLLYQKTGSNVSLANAYINRGILYSAVSEYAKSVAAYSMADSIYAAEKLESSRATTLNNIANVYYLQSDYEKSMATFKKAEEKLIPGIVDEMYLIVKENIAECEFYLKNTAKAESSLLELLPLAQKKQLARISGSIAVVLGKLYYSKGQYAEAEKYLKISKDLAIKTGEIERIVEASMYAGKTALAMNNKKDSYANLSAAANTSAKYTLSKFDWETQYELALYHYQNNANDSAIVHFKEAVTLVENKVGNLYGGEEAKKKYSSDEKKVDLYSKLVAVLAKENKTEEAWFYANKSNSAALKEKMGGVSVNESNKEKATAVNLAANLLQKQDAIDKAITDLKAKPENQQSAQQIESLYKKKSIASAEYLNYIQQLIEAYPDLSEYFKKNANPEEFKKYKSKLPSDVAAILYLINDNQLLIFTVTNEKIGIKVIDMKEDINTTISQYIGLLNLPGKASGTTTLQLRSTVLRERKPVTGVSFIETSEKLYGLLIKEILPDIQDKKKLCIIPNGRLTNIPFQCLGQRMADSSFHFLVEDYSIFYTSKLDIFLETGTSSKNFESFTAFGNPDKSLPSAGAEVTAIGKIATKAIILTEDAATEEKAKQSLNTNKYVHFATHGILDYTNFKNSYLKFASNSKEDGKLTIEEVKTLDITDCELVTLSACETAITQELKKGWYVSPANSFLINNVKTVVASLWSVDDNATSILMKEFYTNLQTMGKAEALRKAQATLSKDPKYVHPFYWGAFVLYGDWR